MKRVIRIGLSHPSAGWESLLKQIGVDWDRITSHSDYAKSFSCIINNGPLSKGMSTKIDQFQKTGGAVIDAYGSLSENSLSVAKISSILPESSDTQLGIHDPVDVYAQCNQHKEAQFLKKTIFVHTSKPFAFIGLPVSVMMGSDASSLKSFPTAAKPYPAEHVQKRSKQVLVHLLVNILVRLHERIKLPFVHKWWYPDQADSVFMFRIDSDFGGKRQVNELGEFLSRNEIRPTWFLHVLAHEKWLNKFSTWRDHELALHCMQHKAYSTSGMYKSDIITALNTLKSNDIKPAGYASTYGLWNSQVRNALKKFTFSYSSEFSYDYDNYPSYPISEQGLPLQIPVHPICIGTLRRAGYTDDQMISYFIQIIEKKRAAQEPIALYHHPLDEKLNVWQEVFSYLKTHKLENLTLYEWAVWWKERLNNTFLAYVENNELFIRSSTNSPKQCYAVHPSSNQFLINSSERLSLENMKTKSYYNLSQLSDSVASIPPDIRKFSVYKLKSEIMTRLWRL
jgi:hypothetical protein